MILVNVLFIVALAAIVVTLMVTAQDAAADRAVRLRQAAQAGAYAKAGELSAVVALRRDARDAPQTDHMGEPWAAIQDRDVAIDGGRFSLSIRDQQALFNINMLRTGGLVAEDRLARILAVGGLRPALRAPIVAYVRLTGGLSDLGQLSILGLTPAEIEALGRLATALPRETVINLNTADEALLAVVLDSPVTARLLTATRRARGGVVTQQDLAALNVIAPPGVGFTSDFYEVITEVRIGETRQRIVSDLMRRRASGRPEVIVYARHRTATEPGVPSRP